MMAAKYANHIIFIVCFAFPQQFCLMGSPSRWYLFDRVYMKGFLTKLSQLKLLEVKVFLCELLNLPKSNFTQNHEHSRN